jgi:hypothetical protein
MAACMDENERIEDGKSYCISRSHMKRKQQIPSQTRKKHLPSYTCFSNVMSRKVNEALKHMSIEQAA